MKKQKITAMLTFILSAEFVGALSGLLSGSSFSFYRELTKPPLSPPGWIFPVVWVILYALMGISAFMISESDSKGKTKALAVYRAQLFVNFLWSIIFFRFRMTDFAAVIIITLLILIIAMIIIFRKIRPYDDYLNIPYLLWVIFASYLNIAILLRI
jgi:tryptophan-rich sensory protein